MSDASLITEVRHPDEGRGFPPPEMLSQAPCVSQAGPGPGLARLTTCGTPPHGLPHGRWAYNTHELVWNDQESG